MPWLVLDAALAVVALVALGLTGLSVWRAVKALGREVARAGTEVGDATASFARAQTGAPTSAAPPVAPR